MKGINVRGDNLVRLPPLVMTKREVLEKQLYSSGQTHSVNPPIDPRIASVGEKMLDNARSPEAVSEDEVIYVGQ